MFVDCKLSFRNVERQSFLRFCDALRPLATKALPKRTELKKLITKRARLAITDVHHEISLKVEDGHGVGICVDGWESITKEHHDGVILFAGGEAYVVEFIRGGTEHHALAVATEWEELMKWHGEDYPILYHCSDDAGHCARARRILRLRRPHILFMKCFAHQVSEKLNLEMWCLMDCCACLPFFLTTFLSRRSISWSALCSRCNRSAIQVTRQSNVQRRSASHQVNGCPF